MSALLFMFCLAPGGLLKYLALNSRKSLPPPVSGEERDTEEALEEDELEEDVGVDAAFTKRGEGGEDSADEEEEIEEEELISRASALLLTSALGEVPAPVVSDEEGEEEEEDDDDFTAAGGRVRWPKGEDVLPVPPPGRRVGVEAERVATGMLNALTEEEDDLPPPFLSLTAPITDDDGDAAAVPASEFRTIELSFVTGLLATEFFS